jgi:hypothetical protein
MTKENIIDDLIKNYSPKELQKEKIVKEIQYKSMDIYAKQDALEFEEWKIENNWEWSTSAWYNERKILWYKVGSEKITSVQLYELYLQSKNQ